MSVLLERLPLSWQDLDIPSLNSWSVYAIVFAVPSYFVVSSYLKRKKLLDSLSTIPGPSPWPVVGNINLLWETGKPITQAILEVLANANKTYGHDGLFLFYIGSTPTVHLTRSDTVSKFLTSKSNIDKPFEYKLLDRWIGGGLLTGDGDQWRANRKRLTPAFHSKIMEDFIPLINRHSRVFCDILSTQPEDLVKCSLYCSLDIILESSMGTTESFQEKGDNDYVRALTRHSELYIRRSGNPFLRKDWFYYNCTRKGREAARLVDTMHKCTNAVIAARKQKMVENDGQTVEVKKVEPLIDILLRAHLVDKTMTEVEVRTEVDTFTFAGFDTTAVAVAFALFNLGHNPAIQEKLYQELYDVLGDDLEKDITKEDMVHMTFAEMVIKESMRLMPSVPIFARHVTQPCELNGHTLPAGITVFVDSYILHRDPLVFPCPDDFNPDNFSPEASAARDPMAFVPFSSGTRNCIGQKFAMHELKVIIGHVVRRFKVKSLTSVDDLHLADEIILKPKSPMKMEFEERF